MTNITRESMDELGAQFHMLMGNAISNWARVEAYLFKICRAALGATSQRTAIVYGRTPTLEARRLLINDLLETTLPVRPQNGGTEDSMVISAPVPAPIGALQDQLFQLPGAWPPGSRPRPGPRPG